jgi:hypothetical protein
MHSVDLPISNVYSFTLVRQAEAREVKKEHMTGCTRK